MFHKLLLLLIELPSGLCGLSFSFGGHDVAGGRITSQGWWVQLCVYVCKHEVRVHMCGVCAGKRAVSPLFMYARKERKRESN